MNHIDCFLNIDHFTSCYAVPTMPAIDHPVSLTGYWSPDNRQQELQSWPLPITLVSPASVRAAS
jgi:hypothetical protein